MQDNYCRKAVIAKIPSFASLFWSPQLGQTKVAGPWLLPGVKAEPLKAAEHPLEGTPGDGYGWTSPRHRWKGQPAEAAGGQILSQPFVSGVQRAAAVLGAAESQIGLRSPQLPWSGWVMVQETPDWPGRCPLLLHPSAQPSSALPVAREALPRPRHFVPGTFLHAILFRDQAWCRRQVSSWWGHRPPCPHLCPIRCIRDFLVTPFRKNGALGSQRCPKPVWAVAHLNLRVFVLKEGPHSPSSQTNEPTQENRDSLLLGWVLKGVLTSHEPQTAQFPPFLISPSISFCCTWGGIGWPQAFLLPRWLLRGRTEVRELVPAGLGWAPCPRVPLPPWQRFNIAPIPATEYFPES